MDKSEIEENGKPLPEQKFLSELSKHTAFGMLTLKMSFSKFKKEFSNEYYAQKSFEGAVNRAMVEAVSVEHAVTQYFIENNKEEIMKRPFRIRGKILEQDENEKWKAELYVTAYDVFNPGVEVTETLKITTSKTIKKEALEELNDMGRTVLEGAMKGFGGAGQIMNMKTGKAL